MSQPRNSRHWAAQQERGSFVLMKFIALAVRLLGRRTLSPLLYLIVLYFFLLGGQLGTSRYLGGKRGAGYAQTQGNGGAYDNGLHDTQPSKPRKGTALREAGCVRSRL